MGQFCCKGCCKGSEGELGVNSPRAEDYAANKDSSEELAKQTHFSVNEVEALYELFSTVSNSIVSDGLIHKEEFQVALFGTLQEHLFADRVFTLFDEKKNGVIEFGEFVRSLSVFHPAASLQEKADFAFRVYDLGTTGAIERSEMREMLEHVIRHTPELHLPADALEAILDQTFKEVDLAGDGRIHPEEWNALCQRSPHVLNNMTLVALRDLTIRYPSYVFQKLNSQKSMKSPVKNPYQELDNAIGVDDGLAP